MAGVKNILDMVNLVEVVAADIKSAKADGSINLFDIPKFADVLPALNEAIDGAGEIMEEFKDLDSEECNVIITRLVGAFKEVAGVFSKGDVPIEIQAILEKGLELVTSCVKLWVLKK